MERIAIGPVVVVYGVEGGAVAVRLETPGGELLGSFAIRSEADIGPVAAALRAAIVDSVRPAGEAPVADPGSLLDELLESASASMAEAPSARRAAPTVADVIAAQGDAVCLLFVFRHGHSGVQLYAGKFGAPETVMSPSDGLTQWRIPFDGRGPYGGTERYVAVRPWEVVYLFSAQIGGQPLYGLPRAEDGFAGLVRFLAEKLPGREPLAVGVLARPSSAPFVPDNPFEDRLSIPADSRAVAWRTLRSESHVARAVRSLAKVESDEKAREFLAANAENRKQTRVVVYGTKTGHTYVAMVFPQGVAPSLLVHREPNRGRWTPRAAEAGETDAWKEVASAFLSDAYAEPVGDESQAKALHRHLRSIYAQGGKVLGADDREAIYLAFASAPDAYASSAGTVGGELAELAISLRVDVSDVSRIRFGQGAVSKSFGDANVERFAEIPIFWPRGNTTDPAKLRKLILALRKAAGAVASRFRPFSAAAVAYLRDPIEVYGSGVAPCYYMDSQDLYRLRMDIARELGDEFSEVPKATEEYHPVIRTRQTGGDIDFSFRPFSVRVREIAVRHGDAVFVHPLDDDGTPMISASAVARTPVVRPYQPGDSVYIASIDANGVVVETGARKVGARPEDRIYRVRHGESVASYAGSDLASGRASEQLMGAVRALFRHPGSGLDRYKREQILSVERAASAGGAEAEVASNALVAFGETTNGAAVLASREAERAKLSEMASELAAAVDAAIKSGDGYGEIGSRAADGGPSVAARVASIRSFAAEFLLPEPDLSAFTAERVNAAAKSARESGASPEDFGVDVSTAPRDDSGRRYSSARDLVVVSRDVEVRGSRYGSTKQKQSLVTGVRTVQLSRWMADYANGGVDAKGQSIESHFHHASKSDSTGLWSTGAWEVPAEAPHVKLIEAGTVLRELVPPAHGTETTRAAVTHFVSVIASPHGGARMSLTAAKVAAARGASTGPGWFALPLWIESEASGSLRLRLHKDLPLYLVIDAVPAEGSRPGNGRFVYAEDDHAGEWTIVVPLTREPSPAPTPDNPLALWRMSVREAQKVSGYKARAYLESIRVCHGFSVANALRHGWPVPIEAREPHGFLAAYPLDGAPVADVSVTGDDGAAFVVAHSAEQGTTVTPLQGASFKDELIKAMRSLPHGLAGFKWLDEEQRYYRQQSRGTARPTANLASLADHIRRITGQPVRVSFTETSDAEARAIYLKHKSENAERNAARSQALADRAEKLIEAAHGARDRSFAGNTERRRRLAAGSHERLLREARDAQRRAKDLAGRAVRVARVAGAEPRSIEEYISNAIEVAARVDKKSAVDLFRQEREQFERAMASNGGADFFPTSSEIAARMADEAGVGEFDTVLEPSAGMGVLVDAAVSRGASVFALELDTDRVEYLRARYGANDRVAVLHGDFLEDTGQLPRTFDAVLMNPPFSAEGTRHGYAKHIRRALELLRPGGTIAAIAPRSLMFSEDREPRELRELFASWGAVPVDLPDDAFKAAGTQVRTVLVVARKPGGDEERDDGGDSATEPASGVGDDFGGAIAEAASAPVASALASARRVWVREVPGVIGGPSWLAISKPGAEPLFDESKDDIGKSSGYDFAASAVRSRFALVESADAAEIAMMERGVDYADARVQVIADPLSLGEIEGALRAGMPGVFDEDRTVPLVGGVSALELYRSVSPRELDDIRTTGCIVGAGNKFSGDSRDMVFFGVSLSSVIHNGEDVSREVHSREEVRAMWEAHNKLREAAKSRRDKDVRALKMSEDRTRSRVNDLVSAERAKREASGVTSYVIVVNGVPGGTVYEGPKSLAVGAEVGFARDCTVSADRITSVLAVSNGAVVRTMTPSEAGLVLPAAAPVAAPEIAPDDKPLRSARRAPASVASASKELVKRIGKKAAEWLTDVSAEAFDGRRDMANLYVRSMDEFIQRVEALDNTSIETAKAVEILDEARRKYRVASDEADIIVHADGDVDRFISQLDGTDAQRKEIEEGWSRGIYRLRADKVVAVIEAARPLLDAVSAAAAMQVQEEAAEAKASTPNSKRAEAPGTVLYGGKPLALQPGDRIVVTKGSAKIGLALRMAGKVKAISVEPDRTVRVRLWFHYALRNDLSRNELTLYARHPNRLSDDEISLSGGNGVDRVLIRKQ